MHKSCRNRPLKSDGFQARNPRDSSSPIFRGKNLLRFREGTTPLTSPNDIGFLPLFVPHICSPIFPFPESFRDSPCFTPPSPWTTPGALRESLRFPTGVGPALSQARAVAAPSKAAPSASRSDTAGAGGVDAWSWSYAELGNCSWGWFFLEQIDGKIIGDVFFFSGTIMMVKLHHIGDFLQIAVAGFFFQHLFFCGKIAS